MGAVSRAPPRRNVHFAFEWAVPTVILECKMHISAKKPPAPRPGSVEVRTAVVTTVHFLMRSGDSEHRPFGSSNAQRPVSPSHQKDPGTGQDRHDGAGGPGAPRGGAIPAHCPRFAPVLTRPSRTIAPIPVPELPVLVRTARWTQSLRRSLDTVSGEAHPTRLSEFSGEKVCAGADLLGFYFSGRLGGVPRL